MGKRETVGYSMKTFNEDPIHSTRGQQDYRENTVWNIPKRNPINSVRPYQLVEIFNLPGRSSVDRDHLAIGVTFNLEDVYNKEIATAVLIDGTFDIELLSNLEDKKGTLRYRSVIGKIPKTLVKGFQEMVTFF